MDSGSSCKQSSPKVWKDAMTESKAPAHAVHAVEIAQTRVGEVKLRALMFHTRREWMP